MSECSHYAVIMTLTLTLRKVPAVLHDRLKSRALRNRRSLNQEVLALLEGALDAPGGDREARIREIVTETDRLRGRMKRPATADEIDAAMSEGRR